MKHYLSLLCSLLLLSLTSCWVEHEAKIDCDKKVDQKLEGVWKRIPLTAAEEAAIKDDLPEEYGWDYIIFEKIDDSRYKVIPLTSTKEEDSESVMFEFVAGTKKHKETHYLSASFSQATIENNSETEEEKKQLGNHLLMEYTLDAKGKLTLKLMDGQYGLEEALKAHPMKYVVRKDESFAPLTFTGTQKEILDFYSDPNVRKWLTNMGNYQKLIPAIK